MQNQAARGAEGGDGAVRPAVVLAAVEGIATIAFAVVVGITSLNSTGSSAGSSPIVQIAVYLGFAALMLMVARALRSRRSLARTPFLVIQAFVLIAGWTVFEGSGWAKAVGAVMLGVGAAGLVVGLRPSLAAALHD